MKTTVWLSAMICLMLLALCLTLAACGQNLGQSDEQSSDQGEATGEIAFQLNKKGDAYTVTGIGTFTGTELVIPATYENLPVKSIEKEAFKDCTQLTEIELPEGILIDEYAFAGCTGLKQVTVPKDADCKNGAFADCTGLESATLYSSNGERMFENCTALKHLTFGADTHIDVNYKTLGKIAWTVTNYEDIPDGAWDYEQVYETDENGETVYETGEYGEQVAKVSHYIVREYLGIESVSGGILNFQSDLMGLPMLTSVENYTIEGEHYWIDGVLIGDSKLSYEDEDPSNDGPYSILWVSPQLETLNMKELAPYFPWIMAQKSIIKRYAAYPMVKTIYLHAEFNELINNRVDFTPSDSVTDIYYMGTVVEWLEIGGTYYGDTCTIHCTDGDISKELGAALMYTEPGVYWAYLSLYRIYSDFPADVAYMLEQYNGNAVPKGFDHVCGQDAWTRENEKAAESNAQQNGEEYVEHICGYEHFLAIDASGAQYEAYAEYKDAQQGTKEYDLYQLYLSYRTAHSRFITQKDRRISEIAAMYRYNQTIGAAGTDIVPAIEEYVNVHLPLLAELYGCKVEYEAGKEGDLTAVTNLEQLPKLIKDDIQTFAALLQEGAPLTPAEAEQLYQEALAMILESGVVTQEELNDRLG